MAQYRQERLGREIQRIVSEMIQFELRDPRVNLASVTRVEVSGDKRHAKVYISAVTEQDRDQAADVLQRARGFLRKGVASRLSLQFAPELTFIADKAIVGGDQVLALIRDLAEPTRTDDH